MAYSETTSGMPQRHVRSRADASAVDIIAHRGFWLRPEERNTETAFRRALEAGFGIETDIRDRNGEAVIAHDVSDPGSMTLEELFKLYREYGAQTSLALNIKADGLQGLIGSQIQRFGVDRYFVFDMSIPDMLGYRAQGIRYFARASEYEETAIGLDEADGVWLDQFKGDWVTEAVIQTFIGVGKNVCIVSPELHKRGTDAWSNYRGLAGRQHAGRISLCTDFPSRAREFFV